MVGLIIQLTLVTGLVVGFLLLVYYLLRQNPRLLQGFQLSALMPAPSSGDVGLVIESRLPLDAKKSLMIVRAGQERYLIGATIDRIDAIARMGDGVAAVPMENGWSQPPITSVLTSTPDADPLPPAPIGLSRFAPAPAVNRAAAPVTATFQQHLAQAAYPSGAPNPIGMPGLASTPFGRRPTRPLNKVT